MPSWAISAGVSSKNFAVAFEACNHSSDVRCLACADMWSSALFVYLLSAVSLQGYWIVRGSEPLPDEGGQSVDHFSLTPTVKANVRAFARALSLRKHPLLLQGPTSSGKTTLVEYMACLTGHQTVRINNHQHTDLQVCCTFACVLTLMATRYSVDLPFRSSCSV